MDKQEFINVTNEQNAFMKHSGIRITKVQEDYAEAELVVSEELMNPFGSLHGGAYYTMADCAAGAAACSLGEGHVTLSGNLNFIRGTASGRVKAVANVVHRGRSTCVVRVVLTGEGGKLLSDGSFTMFHVARLADSAV